MCIFRTYAAPGSINVAHLPRLVTSAKHVEYFGALEFRVCIPNIRLNTTEQPFVMCMLVGLERWPPHHISRGNGVDDDTCKFYCIYVVHARMLLFVHQAEVAGAKHLDAIWCGVGFYVNPGELWNLLNESCCSASRDDGISFERCRWNEFAFRDN